MLRYLDGNKSNHDGYEQYLEKMKAHEEFYKHLLYFH